MEGSREGRGGKGREGGWVVSMEGGRDQGKKEGRDGGGGDGGREARTEW